MRAVYDGLVFLQFLSITNAVCVLESEFGFILNCNFKKSGLFRVRNLGGLKAHIGLGFSFGDELGLSESLGNLEGNRRRALNFKTGYTNRIGNVPLNIDDTQKMPSALNKIRNFGQNQNFSSMTEAMLLPLSVPTFRPIPTISKSNNQRSDVLSTSGNLEGTFFVGNISQNQVMNAPKEYYPSGYDKNFDDNFKSKTNLPLNGFTCSEQKYFPGLYANIELGCMVFHVCAVTEKGIVMKSFLCPESTLFDQSILKCNWWFYVDCYNSSYDSNIPVSKSYKIMKSLSTLLNVTKN
ncbi:uncharacterized protein LOC129938720 [Eupeodes corollae]|uniref:uncharacterized protein LOC129938720 n=1 Tax=Eupeodes corollae TaxID=290404 RepID=UPI002490B564|nr:uncharacterized protein LOC129938720 [Eupeodes corollae]XP_055902411.1 uncharacterized protein LOC129938720 [Eupeodes corollae]XP_055902412.1 uncharacterized protein LOC129938720 [Eupeodes corollae]XP_055902413.1 uncharacterized protein LOC129938720 [Eupeodes corollae]